MVRKWNISHRENKIMAKQKSISVPISKKKAPKYFNNVFISVANSIAKKVGANSVLIYADFSDNLDQFKELNSKSSIILATKDEETYTKAKKIFKNVLRVPKVNLTRIGKIKISVMKAVSAGLVVSGDKIVCLSGVQQFGYFDNLIVLDIGKEFEVFTSANLPGKKDKLKPEVFESVLTLAIELANQGREGRPIGTIFVIGSHEKVLQFSRQLIINPFQGYQKGERNIMDPQLRETIKEFSALDGAFVIQDDGVVTSAGRYLSAALNKEDFPQGLGSRHVAAAGITSVTDATAIVISESTGTVRIYKKGTIFMEIEKPTKKYLNT